MASETMTSPRALICEDVGVTVLQIRKALLKAFDRDRQDEI